MKKIKHISRLKSKYFMESELYYIPFRFKEDINKKLLLKLNPFIYFLNL